MKKILLISFFCFSCALFSGEGKKDLPENTFGYFYTPNLSQFLNRAETFFSSNSLSSSKIQEFLGTILLKTTQLESLDLSKEFFYLRLNVETCPAPFLYKAYIRDEDLFLSGLGKGLLGGSGFKLKEETRNQPIQEFSEEKVSFDRDNYLKALEKGEADPVKFQTKITIPYFVAFSGSQVIVSGDRALLEKFLNDPLSTPKASEENDCEIMLKPAYLYQSFLTDIPALKEKFKPVLEKNQQWVVPLLQFLENQIQNTPLIKSRIKMDKENFEISLHFYPEQNSVIALDPSILIKNPQSKMPPQEVNGILSSYILPSEQLLKNTQFTSNPQAQNLIREYLLHMEGFLNLYSLSDEKGPKFLINLSPKKGVDEAQKKFNRLFQEGYTAVLHQEESVTIVEIGQKKLYTTLAQNQQWIGLGFDSQKSFKDIITKICERKNSQASEVYKKATDGFPNNLSILLYYQSAGNLVAGYVKREKDGNLIFLRIEAKDWLDGLKRKKEEKTE